ncbi:MAG TPA: glycosyl hydrolase 108 family protein [Rhodopila sp.]|nr:glycosyl hydrolase 108 family protein [Rhodopila sp.]
MSIYEKAFSTVVGDEGGYGNDPRDPGNWTSGKVGEGECLGTKYGFASSQWASNIAKLPEAVRGQMPAQVKDLTPELARIAYKLLYWETHRCDDLPGPIAYLVFDAAVNGGAAGRWLQLAVGAEPDGDIGDLTIAAVNHTAAKYGGARICAEFIAEHMAYLTSLPTWPIFGADMGKPEGWARRLAKGAYVSMSMIP